MLLLLLLAPWPAALSQYWTAGLAAAPDGPAAPFQAGLAAAPAGPAGDWTEGCRDFTFNECDRAGNFQVGWLEGGHSSTALENWTQKHARYKLSSNDQYPKKYIQTF